MTAYPAAIAAADQVAATLRDRRTRHDGQACDAFDPCEACQVGREAVQIVRAKARVPAQRQLVRA